MKNRPWSDRRFRDVAGRFQYDRSRLPLILRQGLLLRIAACMTEAVNFCPHCGASHEGLRASRIAVVGVAETIPQLIRRWWHRAAFRRRTAAPSVTELVAILERDPDHRFFG